jgi:hypothetical protein
MGESALGHDGVEGLVEQPVGEATALMLKTSADVRETVTCPPRCLKTRLLGRRCRPSGETAQRHTLAPGDLQERSDARGARLLLILSRRLVGVGGDDRSHCGSESGAMPGGLAAVFVEEVPDSDVELVGSFDVAEVTGVRQDDEPGAGDSCL